ncbi:MAG TPA: TIGR02453 family protein [Vicinamibacterales bacterium]
MAFGPGLFAFLRDLKRHNHREWFEANRPRYVADVETPLLAFIREVGERLPGVCPGFVADPRRSGGSMFRIYRDTRFAADKTPYKTWLGARFGHRKARKATTGLHAPAFYLHLAADESYGGGGIYHADTSTLTRIRQRIVSHPQAWAAVLKSGVELQGDTLKRPPAGFDKSHRFIEDLKRKDLYGLTDFTPSEVTSSRFIDRYMKACAKVVPLVEFLTSAVGLDRA